MIKLLAARTGGGHMAAAHALREALPSTVIDGLAEGTPWPWNRFHAVHAWAGQHPWAMRFIFGVDSGGGWLYDLTLPLVRPRLERLLEAELVVSLHPILTQYLARLRRRPPLAVLVTELARAPRSAFHPGADLTLVATPELAEQARSLGVRAEIAGLPVRVGTGRREERILLLGGQEGYGGPLFSVARALDGLGVELVVITGRNRELRRRLEEARWRSPVRILGLVDDVPDWMARSALLVSKAGPGTLSEAFAAGLPVLLFGYLEGTERYNVDYLERHGAGEFHPEPSALARAAARILADPGEMSARSRALGQPQAARLCAERILQLRERSS